MKIEGLTRGQLNFRDLGGIPVQNGRVVKSGMFYRSAGLYWMRSAERAVFQTLGIRSVLDLRSKEESKRCPDPLFPQVEIVQHSGVVTKGGEEIDFSIHGMNKIGQDARDQLEKLTQYYKEMPFGNNAIQVMFEKILAGNTPIVLHCAVGKDRTGVAVMVLLTALGARDQDILEDYMKSKEERRENLEKIYTKYADRLEGHPELKELLTMKEGVSETIGRAVLQEIHNRYETPEMFLWTEYGLGKEELQRLCELGTCEK